jgi:hypothetical protein
MISGSGNSRRRRGHGRNRKPNRYGVRFWSPSSDARGHAGPAANGRRHSWPAKYGAHSERNERSTPWKILPVAVPMALGLTLGMVLALSGGPGVTKLSQSALGSRASANANAAGFPDPGASASPANTPAAQQAQNMDCTLIVPANPLTAAGLATPWQLTGPDGQDPAASGCQQSNPDLSAFVQATILNPRTGRLAVYEPLVITLGTTPAVAPITPKLAPGAVVNIMVGFNGGNLRLVGAQARTLAQAHCVNGAGNSLFGQVSYCDSPAFYQAADTDMALGRLRIPAAGTSPVTGQACPTTRSFNIVDQDPSDNVTTQYLLLPNGQTAQVNPANKVSLGGAQVISNGSDNALLDNFVLPALDCAPFTAPDLSADGKPGTSQTLDELSAARSQRAPIALVPENDPMTMVNGNLSIAKTDLYRIGVGQPLVEGGAGLPFARSDGATRLANLAESGGQQADTPANFCANVMNVQTAFVAANSARFANVTSPVPATGTNLFTFMAARLSASFANLNCADFGLRNTVHLRVDNNGVATAATLNLTAQPSVGATTPAQPQPSQEKATPWWTQIP